MDKEPASVTPAFVIQELARQVRRDTLQLIETTPEDRLTWAPPGTSNHILWHAGHSLWLQGVICLELLTDNSELHAPPLSSKIILYSRSSSM
jgi:hypothetical protein